MSTNKPVNAIDFILEQHREIESYFTWLKQTTDPEHRTSIFEILADQVAIHMSIEENYLNPALRDGAFRDDTRDEISSYSERSSYETSYMADEHTAVRGVLSHLVELDVRDKTFNALLSVLEEQVRHHFRDEERNILPQARRMIPVDELEILGQQMVAAHAHVESQLPHPRAWMPADKYQQSLLQSN